jgi:RNA polymerase sigma factor (sigma-70 family)
MAPINARGLLVLHAVANEPETDRPPDRFDDLFQRLYVELYGLACSVVGGRSETEDIVQEAFLKLIDAPVLDRPDNEVRAWLRRVCLNLSFNRVRDRRRAQARLERAGRLEIAGADGQIDDPSALVLSREARDEVRLALAELPERQRNCVLLRHSGYSYAEIAATVGVAVGSVGVLLARGERAFRDIYEEQRR